MLLFNALVKQTYPNEILALLVLYRPSFVFLIAIFLILQEMKAMLYTAVEEAPSDESVEPEVISRHFASFDEVFFTFCDRELKKINTFYSGKSLFNTNIAFHDFMTSMNNYNNYYLFIL